MNFKALLLLVLAAVLPLSAPPTAQATPDVSFDYFYDSLLPYGEWIEVEGYGFCWHPTEVDPDWVPYSDGYWAFTDAGWTWVGYEEFAGIVYHYGRWLLVETIGWCWKPDYEWGPGWVSWRNSDDYVGWAPLPPRAHWQPEIGISTWVDTAYDIGPGSYNFCRTRDFGAPVLRTVILSRTRNVTIIRNTVNITNITYNTYGDMPVIYNGGPSYGVMSRRSERPIPALKLVRTTHFERPDFRRGPGGFSPNARTVGNQLLVNAPIVAPPVQPAFLKDKVKRVFAADKVANGWAGVKDRKERDDLRQRFQRETKGLTPYTAPARAVVAADLKVVPAQADPTAVSPVFTGKGPRGKGDRQPTTIPDSPVAPVQPVNPVTDTTKPMRERGADNPPAVTGGPLKPFNRDAVTNPVVTAPEPGKAIDPRGAEKIERPKMGRDVTPNPLVVVPPDAPVTGTVPPETRGGRGPKPMKDSPAGGFHPPGVDPAAAQAQAAAEAAKAAREQANIQQQKMDGEKLRAAQAEADKARSDQERMSRQRDAEASANAIREKQAAERDEANTRQQKMNAEKLRAAQAEAEKAKAGQERITREREADANAAAMRQKQAADAAAANAEKEKMQSQQQQRAAQAEREKLQGDQERMTRQREADAAAAAQQKQLEAQRQAEAAKRQQMEAQGQERQRQQQEQIAEQRRQAQMEQQRAAQEAAKQQVAEQRRQQQIEAQRAAQDAAKQQAMEQRRQQQMEQQRASQEAAKQQAENQRRAMDAQREQATRQQADAQRAAQQQAAQDARRGEKEKDKDKDKDKGR